MSAPIDVLAIAAHPDDAEVGCGGVLAQCARAGLRVAIADLTAGEASTHGTPEERAAEREDAAQLLGLATRVLLGLPDTQLGTDVAHRLAVTELLRGLRPRIVLAPYWEDRHPDHAVAGRLAREACFLAGARAVGAGAPHRPEQLYHYMLHEPFPPTFVVDVTDVWEQRTAAVRAYRSQFGRPAHDRATAIAGDDFLGMIADRASAVGALVGAARGEAFRCRGPLGVPTLPGLDGDRPVGLPAYRAYL